MDVPQYYVATDAKGRQWIIQKHKSRIWYFGRVSGGQIKGPLMHSAPTKKAALARIASE